MRILDLRELPSGARIRATGAYLPSRIITNQQLCDAGGPLSPDEIERGLGVVERRRAAANEATSDLATHACRDAIARAKIGSEDVDRLIVATVSPDHPSPSTACFVHHQLKLCGAPALDVVATCAGFVYALDHAARAVLTGDRYALVCAADIRSRFVNPLDRTTFAIFGDGAGAAVVEGGPRGKGLLGIGLYANGEGREAVVVPAGGSRKPATAETVQAKEHFVRMADGPQVYLAMIEGMVGTAEQLLGALQISMNEIALIVPHQANGRVLTRLARLWGVGEERVFSNVAKYGNMSGASTAVAFHEALRDPRLTAGDKILLVAGGAGYTAGAAVIELDDALLLQARSL